MSSTLPEPSALFSTINYADVIAGLDLTQPAPPAQAPPRKTQPNKRRRADVSHVDEDLQADINALLGLDGGAAPAAAAAAAPAAGQPTWEQAQQKLLPGYVLSDDCKWAYGPKDPRDGVRLAHMHARRFEAARQMAQQMQRPGGPDNGGSGGDDIEGVGPNGVCVLCEFLEDVDRSQTVSTAVNMINSAADTWTNGRSESVIAADMAKMWNNSVHVHAQRMNLDVPRLTTANVAWHRRHCLVRNFDARLTDSITRATDLADSIGETAVYRWRILADGSMSQVPLVDPKGARLWLASYAAQCRLVREARGAVPSRNPGRNAARKEFGDNAADNGVSRATKLSSGSGGGMSVMRVGGPARAVF